MASHSCQRRRDGSKLLTCVAIAIGAFFGTSFCGCGFQTTPLSAIYLRLQIRSSQQGMMQTQYQNSQLASSQELLTAKTLNSWIRLTFRHLSLRCIFLETAKCFLRRWPLTGHNCTLLVSVKSDVKQFFESLEVTSKEVS